MALELLGLDKEKRFGFNLLLLHSRFPQTCSNHSICSDYIDMMKRVDFQGPDLSLDENLLRLVPWK